MVNQRHKEQAGVFSRTVEEWDDHYWSGKWGACRMRGLVLRKPSKERIFGREEWAPKLNPAQGKIKWGTETCPFTWQVRLPATLSGHTECWEKAELESGQRRRWDVEMAVLWGEQRPTKDMFIFLSQEKLRGRNDPEQESVSPPRPSFQTIYLTIKLHQWQHVWCRDSGWFGNLETVDSWSEVHLTCCWQLFLLETGSTS